MVKTKTIFEVPKKITGTFLRRWRKFWGLTQENAADWCHVRVNTWRTWETEIYNPPEMIKHALVRYGENHEPPKVKP